MITRQTAAMWMCYIEVKSSKSQLFRDTQIQHLMYCQSIWSWSYIRPGDGGPFS